MLTISQYRKAYGERNILQIQSLQLDPGIYWIKGENGAGKTTLFQSIAGLIPFEGAIDVCNISLRKQRRQYTKLVSFGEAEPDYPPFLTGNELLRFYLSTKGGSEAAATKMAEVFAMTSYLNHRVETYSSGMLKKLSLLLSFTGTPRLILLDEPFITLDVEAVDRLRRQIASAAENGVSFFISSHQELALAAPVHPLRIHQQTIERESHAASA